MLDNSDSPTLLQRVEKFPSPPPTLNLLSASQAELHHYGLPPRPNSSRQTELFTLWCSFFVPRPNFVDPDLVQIKDNFTVMLRQAPTPASAAVSPVTRYETSPNWCGAYVEANNNKVFVQVSGRWTVPRPSPPLNVVDSHEYACSAWVGLDGQRRYLDSSLPQIGTWHSFLSARSPPVQTYAWVQWWAREVSDNFPYQIQGVPVSVGDPVIAMVRVWETSRALFYLKNLRTNLLTRFGVEAPIAQAAGGGQHRYRISGATAEWILERPRKLNSTDLFPLADFDNIEFVHCHAVEANPTLPGWPAIAGADQVLPGARFIRLFEAAVNRTRFLSMPWRTSDTSVRVTYGGFPI
jgi:hypothetical protein